jgi:hypothetical protein
MARSRLPGSRPGSLTAYRVTSWIGRAGVAVAFLLQALSLVDTSWAQPAHAWTAPGVSTSFVFGLLEGLRYLTVVVEVLGAALLFVPGCTAVGALMLSGTAFVTLFARVFVLGDDPIGALFLFLASAALVGQRRRELVAIWRFHTRAHRPSPLLAARQR